METHKDFCKVSDERWRNAVSDEVSLNPLGDGVTWTKAKGYTKQDKIKRLNHQFRRLVGKINYMNRLTSMGRKFGRNTPCPCKSGKKFKKCCMINHEYNIKKLSALQVAMTKLEERVTRYGLRIGRVGVRS